MSPKGSDTSGRTKLGKKFTRMFGSSSSSQPVSSLPSEEAAISAILAGFAPQDRQRVLPYPWEKESGSKDMPDGSDDTPLTRDEIHELMSSTPIEPVGLITGRRHRTFVDDRGTAEVTVTFFPPHDVTKLRDDFPTSAAFGIGCIPTTRGTYIDRRAAGGPWIWTRNREGCASNGHPGTSEEWYCVGPSPMSVVIDRYGGEASCGSSKYRYPSGTVWRVGSRVVGTGPNKSIQMFDELYSPKSVKDTSLMPGSFNGD